MKACLALFILQLVPTHSVTPLTISIKSNSLLCLDLYGGDTRNGAPLQLWECNGHQSQLWLFEPNSFTIQYAADPTKCIDAGAVTEGNKLQIWDCNGVDWQTFGYDANQASIYFTKSQAGKVATGAEVAAPLYSMCLDSYSPVKGGNAVQVWKCNFASQQQFTINFGTSFRVQWSYEMCLDLMNGDTTNGNTVQLWPCNGLANQQWILESGAIRYGSDISKCIDAFNPLKPGANLQIWDCNGMDPQAFGYDAAGNTLYLTKSMGSVAEGLQDVDVGSARPFASYCLDAPNGVVTKGTKPDIWNCNGCWNQQWTVAVCKYHLEEKAPLGKMLSNLSAPQVRDNCPPQPGPGPPGPGPGPVGKPCTAVGGWPKFDSMASLQASPWSQYFTAVYGAVPSGGYPICISDFGMLYTAEMSKAGVKAPAAMAACPASNTKGAWFTHEIAYPAAYPGAGYIYQPPPYTASQFVSNSWVEVMHGVGGGVGNDEKVGAWFYYLKGTGIWFNLGKSISFPDHPQSWAHFKSHPGAGLTSDEALAKAAAVAGYASVVYLEHDDIGTCPTCCKRLGQKAILVEIIGVSLVGKYACAGPKGSGVKAGWYGARSCNCNECGHNCFINCAGVPQLSRLSILQDEFNFSAPMATLVV